MLIRPARPGDEDGIACLHVHSWQSTYRGIIPDEALCNFSIEDRRQMWTDALVDIRDNPGKRVVFVAVEDDQIVGFCCGGTARADNLHNKDAFDAEIYSIYVEAGYHGRGIGADLFVQTKDWLYKHNFRSMFLWAFADNPFLYFYDRMGGIQGDEERINNSLGIPLKIITYAWNELKEGR